MTEFIQRLKKERLILAPLTKGGNLPFRRLCTELGAPITVSEMAYAHKLLKKDRRELALLRHHESEKCFGVQLAVNKPLVAQQVAPLVEESGAKFIDLNCGCPIHDAVSRGYGANLLQKPGKIKNILLALKKNSSLPITVKLRIGFKENNINIEKTVASSLEAGVSAITIHGRTREQRYSKKADWELLARIQEQTPVPIIGNGDVLTYFEAQDRFKKTPTEGMMLARGALIKPWLFKEIIEQKELYQTPRERWKIYFRLASLFKEYFGDDERGIKISQQFLSWHFSLFCRYRSYPEQEFLEASREHPLLQTRDDFSYLTDPQEIVLARYDEATWKQLAQILLDSQEYEESWEKLCSLT